MKAPATTEGTAVKAAAREAASDGCVSDKRAAADVSAWVETGTAVEASAIKATPIIPVVPGTGANKDAVYKPVRPVIAAGSAGIGVVAIVAIGTDGSRAIYGSVHWPDADTDSYADTYLRLGGPGTEESQDSEQNSVFDVSHRFNLSGPDGPIRFPIGSLLGKPLTVNKTPLTAKSCRL
jgi:hypothetical protein